MNGIDRAVARWGITLILATLAGAATATPNAGSDQNAAAPNGKYRVKAEYGGTTLQKTVWVRNGKHTDVVFLWPPQAGAE
ncbi:MAG TPA: hypothetical protein VMT94_03195 [Burkholderiales bacterium]|nr:hypothetical protein [Burkholderiales bacterium]